MAERNSPTEEGDVPEGANAYRLLAYADDLVVPAPARRDSAEASGGEDVLEIEYQPEEGLEEAPEDHSPEEARGHESNRGAVRSAEIQEPVQGRTGRRRRRSKSSRERRHAGMVDPRGGPEVHQSCRAAAQQPSPPQRDINEPEEGEEHPLARDRRRRGGPRSTSPTYPCSRRRGPSRERELIEFFGYLEGLPDDLRNRAICDFYGVEPDPEYPEWPGWIVDIMEAGVWNPGRGARK